MSFDAVLIPLPTDPISKDYYTEVRKGNIVGSRIIDVNGVTPLSNATASNIWVPGGLLVYPTVAEQWELVFADPADTAAGTGAQAVTVRYLDDLYVEQSEVVASNGGTVVMTATDSFRFIEMKVTAKGSGNKNAGAITIQVTSAGAVRGAMVAEKNITLHGFYTVPAGKTASVIYGYTGSQKGQDSDMSIFTTDGDDGIFTESLPLVVYQNTFILDPKAPGAIMAAKSDLQVTVVSTGGTSKATVVFQILEVDD